MDERPPGPAVTVHPDHLLGPGVAGQVVDDEVESHARGCTERRRVAQKRRREAVVAERGDVALHEDLALGICRERQDRRRLRAEGVRCGAVDAARGHVDEPLDARLAGHRREADTAAMVDLERHVRVELAERVVRELRQVDHGVEAAQVVDRQLADVGRPPRRRPIDAVVEPADTVEARVDAADVVAAGHQVRREDRADVALAAGDQDAHWSRPGPRPVRWPPASALMRPPPVRGPRSRRLVADSHRRCPWRCLMLGERRHPWGRWSPGSGCG